MSLSRLFATGYLFFIRHFRDEESRGSLSATACALHTSTSLLLFFFFLCLFVVRVSKAYSRFVSRLVPPARSCSPRATMRTYASSLDSEDTITMGVVSSKKIYPQWLLTPRGLTTDVSFLFLFPAFPHPPLVVLIRFDVRRCKLLLFDALDSHLTFSLLDCDTCVTQHVVNLVVYHPILLFKIYWIQKYFVVSNLY